VPGCPEKAENGRSVSRCRAFYEAMKGGRTMEILAIIGLLAWGLYWLVKGRIGK
jgi:hypothetical protein